MKRIADIKIRSLVAMLVIAPIVASANNLTIGDVTLTNPVGGKADIQFSMSWDNSWHESWTEAGGTIHVTNWDAVWVFAKIRQSGGHWKHALLSTEGHNATGNTIIEVPDEGGLRLGALVHRSEAGSGTVTCTNMSLRVDLAALGLPSANEIDIAVMGVEMVYIPEGPYHLGSGGAENNAFYASPDPSTPYLVASDAEIKVGTEPGELTASGYASEGVIPATYPKGFSAFYCMKYEMTEGQYVDFLNLLDPTIATTFYPNAGGAYRNTISKGVDGSYESTAPDRACGNIGSTTRTLGYLDWAALRPMTELEFEKTCRGPRPSWINEYPWGNTTLIALTGFSGVDGSGTETALPAEANCHLSSINGPVRAGIFATGSSTREQSGASYFGVMNLGGNVREFVVSSHVPGRDFTEVHGDGDEYTPPFEQWPSSGNAYGVRGGNFTGSAGYSRTSDRANGSGGTSDDRRHGARGVRSAP